MGRYLDEDSLMDILMAAKDLDEAEVEAYTCFVKEEGYSPEGGDFNDDFCDELDRLMCRHETPWFSEGIKEDLKRNYDSPITREECATEFLLGRREEVPKHIRDCGGIKEFCEAMAHKQYGEAIAGPDYGHFTGYEPIDFMYGLRALDLI